MAHYLRTMNQEAADAIGNEGSGELPVVGDYVMYFPRQGEMPGGSDRYPMLVMKVESDGMVRGFAKAEINSELEVKAYARTANNPSPAWEFIRPRMVAPPGLVQAGEAPSRAPGEVIRTALDGVEEALERVGSLHDEVEQLSRRIASLEQWPSKLAAARIDEFFDGVEDVLRRLTRLEQELGLDDKPKPQRAPPPPAAKKQAAKSKRKGKR